MKFLSFAGKDFLFLGEGGDYFFRAKREIEGLGEKLESYS